MLVLLMAVATTAQIVSPSNGSDYMSNLEIALANNAGFIERVVPVIGLTPASSHYIPYDGLQGPLLLANASSQLQLSPDDIALISCDPYSGNIQPSDVFATAADRNATAILLYSDSMPQCTMDIVKSEYDRVYTLVNQNSTKTVLEAITSMDASYARIARRQDFSSPGNNNNGNSTSSPNSWGPSPSTAVAMIILYSITGIITALFLVIIITGAVRAHRHPERYGPRNGIGRPRQSRARGLAMAMLETIPIVKFGDRNGGEGQRSKTTDVEMADREAEPQEGARDADNAGVSRATDGASEQEPASNQSQEPAIAAAVPLSQTPPAEESSELGCSICTEDFQVGEDQRVLPCDHKFHPACIDPWLLNVSGTCPLCRKDLRPNEEEASSENGALAPPLEDAAGRRRSRRSMLGAAFSRPERMTREERVRALRQLREEQRQAVAGSERQEERGLRERLRNVLRVRTRRTGEEQQQPESSAS